MDPTLADGEILFVVKHLPIDRFDIVVAHEDEGNKRHRKASHRIAR